MSDYSALPSPGGLSFKMNEKSPPIPQEDHERALNLLVYEYLRKRKFMSSSASFSVEAQVVVKPESEIDSQGSFLSDWFQTLFKFLQLSKGTQPPSDVEVKKFLESSKHLFDLHKVSSLPGLTNSNLGAPNSGGPAPSSLKTEGYSSKFGSQGRRDSDEPPAKMHASLANGKTPASSGSGGAKSLPSSSGATSLGVSVPSMYSQAGNAQIRPQFNLSLPSHSAGALANWPGAQGMSSMPPNPMQQGDASMPPQQTMPFSLNGHLPNGAGPPNGIPGQNSDPHGMTALQNGSPAGLKGNMSNQQFMSPQQLMAQQQSQQQRHILFQQNQRYLLQQQMLAGGIMNPNMGYMNHNAMVAIGNNGVGRGMPLYQQREVYAQHHKQVQMLKLQQHNARQQLMLSRQSGAPGQAMGRPAGGDTPDQSGAMSHLNFPGNHPGAAQNPMMMQQMMNMNAMAGFNGGSSAQHPSMGNNNGHPFNGGNPHMGGSMTPNMGNGGTSTPNSVNFEALFASMQNAGGNMNGGMSHNQQPGASPAGGGTDPLKSSTSEEETAKMFGKFVDADIFSIPDNTGNSNSQGLGGGNGAGGQLGDQGSNMDMYSLDPFSQTEFFS